MILCVIILIILIIIYFSQKKESFRDNKLKICILIINIPNNHNHIDKEIYQIQREIWNRYMNKSKEIDCFFIECGKKYIYETSYIISECEECYIPGIYQKTILSLERLQKKNYDFYIRTNLNSFFIFPYLLNLLNKLDLDQPIYSGDYSNIQQWVCGNSIILNNKAVDYLVKYGRDPKYFYDKTTPDDVLIGNVMFDLGIKSYPINNIVYWIINKENNRKINKKILEIKRKQFPIIRTRPNYQDNNYYKKFMNKLVDSFY